MYDSRIARWLSTDPKDQFASPYVAMGGDPVNNMDKDGGESGPGDPPTKCSGCTLNDVVVSTYKTPTNISHLDGLPVMINMTSTPSLKITNVTPPTISSAPIVDNYTQAFHDQWTKDYNTSHGINPNTGRPYVTYPEAFNKLSDNLISPTLNLTLALDGGHDAYLGLREFFNAGKVYLYHYTSVSSAENILNVGMNTEYSSDGFLYLTNKGNLSPLQAQIELALPVNKPLPTSILQIDASKLSPYLIRRVTGNLQGLGAGGGTEYLFNQNIPSNLIKIIK